MSAISQMQSAQMITGSMVRQAMQEAGTDEGKIEQLQQVCEQKHECFENVRVYDLLSNFVQKYYSDCFEFQSNTSNPAALPARITEARISKLKVVERTIDTTPPPPPRRGAYRDPLNITGHAEAGSKVEFYNASQPGRPVIGDVEADANGKFRFELTDETKFDFGDQIGVRVIDGSGKPSKAVVVPTEPFQITNTKTTFTRHGAVVRTDETSTLHALDRKKDERDPFFQADKVEAKFTPPSKPEDPYQLELVGGDDAVEPNSTLSVMVNGQMYKTKADSMGKFGLKVFGFEPGQRLKVEVQDINGKGIDVDYQAPTVALNLKGLTGGINKPPSATKPRNPREVVGEGPPWVHFKAANVTVPDGAVMLRNTTTGDLHELKADDQGSINAAVGGIDNFDVLEIVARDAAGNITEEAELAVMLPEKVGRGMGFLVSADKLNKPQPDVSAVIEAITGPPQDLFIHGKKDPRGPYLKMPDVEGMPPFGQLAVVREGKVMQYLRADQNGRLQGLLRGVNEGDQLNFLVQDAAGRKFPMELHGWRVPGDGQTSTVPTKHVRSDDRTLNGCIGEIGNGSLDLQDSWLEDFTINTGAPASAETNVPLHYKREFFGAAADAENNEASFDVFPPALHKKFGLPTMTSGKLSMSENNGTRRISVDFPYVRSNGRTSSTSTTNFTVGVDYVMGRVNRGNPNLPITVPDHLPQLTGALKSTLAFAALAYESGKEPGDMEYDRAMGAAKTILYVFDRLAVDHPDQKDAILQAAKDALPDGQFNFEILDRYKVPPQGTDRPSGEASAPRTSAMSVLDARTALLGKVSGVGIVGQGDSDSHPAPRIEAASVLSSRANNRYNYGGQPLRVRGRATPGDIVQIFNVSAGTKTLLGETVAGADGKFKLVGGARGVRSGDQIGVMSLTTDGKSSAMMVVPTDAYSYSGTTPAGGIRATPIKADDRPPYLRVGATKLKNVTFDAAGEMRTGQPTWKLTGDELAVEPFSKVKIFARTPDGEDKQIEVEADAQGKFAVEFQHAPRSGFTAQVTDRNGQQQSTHMSTPGLATSIVDGDQASDASAGAVTFRLPSGESVRGIVVAHTLGDAKYDDVKIQPGDRHDEFVDVVINQKFTYTETDGNQRETDQQFKIKLSKEDALLFQAQANATVQVDMPGFASVPRGGGNVEMSPVGEATIRDRDFGSL